MHGNWIFLLIVVALVLVLAGCATETVQPPAGQSELEIEGEILDDPLGTHVYTMSHSGGIITAFQGVTHLLSDVPDEKDEYAKIIRLPIFGLINLEFHLHQTHKLRWSNK